MNIPTITSNGAMEGHSRKRGRPTKFANDDERRETLATQKRQYEERNRETRNQSRRLGNLHQTDDERRNALRLAADASEVFTGVEAMAYQDCGNMEYPCEHCGGLSFQRENGRSQHSCCHQGKIPLTPLHNYDDELLRLLSENTEISKHFRENIRVYNNVFAFASFNCTSADIKGAGPYAMRIVGQANAKATTSLFSSGNPRYGQVYIYDDNETISYRSSQRTRDDVLAMLQGVLKNNPYAQKYRQLYDVFNKTAEKTVSLNFLTYTRDDQRRYNLPQNNDIAAVIVSKDGVIPTAVDVKVFPENKKECDYISIDSQHSDPMLFPLLFPKGDHGWDYRMKTANMKNISPLQFYSSRLTDRGDFNPVLYCGRLTQQFFINCYLVVESQRLKFHRFNQDKLRTECYQGLVDHINGQEVESSRAGNRLVLPGTYQGSPRALHLLYQDAMAISRKIGRPDLFITMTCNPKWPEIKRYLEKFPKGTTASDIPHFTSRLFYQKITLLINDLDTIFGKVLAYVYTVEFQKRGLPHIHLLVTLSKKLLTSDDIDRYISAEIPDKNHHPRLWYKVTRHMLHGPHSYLTPCFDDKTKHCKKNFPKPFCESTDMSGSSFPKYRRRDNRHVGNTYHGKTQNKIVKVDNSMVVPYNPKLLMKYDCHINVEYCASVMSIKYIHKYIHKGHDRARIRVDCDVGDHDVDEIRDFLDTRYLSANECAWRLFELPLHGRSHSVERLPIHLEGKNRVVFVEGKERDAVEKNLHSKLTAYFELNKEDISARSLKYEEIPIHYRWIDNQKRWQARKNYCNTISRLVTISSKATELFHLKLLLRKKCGATGYDDLKTVNGTKLNTFKEAAIELGYVRINSEYEEVLNEASSTLMPSQLRHFFVYMLIGCAEINGEELWNKFKVNLSEDCNEIQAKIHLNNILSKENLSLQSFNIEFVHEVNNFCDEDSVNKEEHSLKFQDMYEKLNEQQKIAFGALNESLFFNNQQNCFFIDGPGGSGKTFLYKCLIHKALSEGKKIVSLAWTGIAAILLPFGKTAHKSFQLPLNVSDVATLYWDVKTKKLLKETDLFLWDEASMIPKGAIESINIALQDTCNCAKPFGGKIFLLGGDFRQVLPVVKKGGRKQIADATIKNSYIWNYFSVFSLSKNMRSNSADTNFPNWLLSIGNGDVTDLTITEDLLSKNLVNEMYGSQWSDEQNINQAILTTRNDIVNELNSNILELMPGVTKYCEGVDEVTLKGSDATDESTERCYPLEYVNTLTPSGFPPQVLRLKVGAIVMLIRNLCVNDGLCNGTRLVVTGIKKHILHCRILTGDHANEYVTIPRIRLDSSTDTELPFILHRTQFPVRLSFAMTINKSQGQTFDRVGIYLHEDFPIFSHGQLYVALSRCRTYEGIRIQVCGKKDVKSIKNIVFKEVL